MIRVGQSLPWFERCYNRLLLLNAPPATPLGTGQYLDACYRTVSCALHQCTHPDEAAADHGHTPCPGRPLLPRVHWLSVVAPAAPSDLPTLADGLRLHAHLPPGRHVGEHPPP